MFSIRKASDRGHAQHGWLESFHTFSFADYYDPRNMGFRSLRVVNEDRVQPGQGFGKHSHRDMEILSYVVKGALEHEDSMGNGSVIRPGDIQLMRAGRGVTHSEFNPSEREPVHFLQIWIVPDRNGLAPAYAQRAFSRGERAGRLRLVASRNGADESLQIAQDARVFASLLDAGQSAAHELAPGRGAWLQIVRGELLANDQPLSAGDGASVEDVRRLTLHAATSSELLLFDLA
jgi:hypothetical protein